MNHKLLQSERPSLVELPLEVSHERYQKAISILVGHWSSMRLKPVSIYQIGQVSAPGISDLDFILVFETDQLLEWHHYQPDFFPKWIQELFTHPPYVTTLKTWPDLQGWHPTFNMRLVWGRELPPPVIQDKDIEQGLSLGMLIDYLSVKLPVDLIYFRKQPSIRVRTLLCMIHSVKYIFLLAQKAKVPVLPDSEAFIRKIDIFRRNWFNYYSPDESTAVMELINLWEESCLLIAKQIQIIHIFLNTENHLYKDKTVGGKKQIFTFTTDFKGEAVMEEILDSDSVNIITKWVHPASFLKIFKHYADNEAEFKRYFKKLDLKFFNGMENTEWEKGLNYHARIMIQNRIENAKMGVPSQKYIALGCIPLNNRIRTIKLIRRVYKKEISKSEILRKLKYIIRSSARSS